MKVGCKVVMNQYSSYYSMQGIIKKFRDDGISFIVELDDGLTLIVTKEVISTYILKDENLEINF